MFKISDIVKPTERVAAFIDGSNTYSATRALNISLDWKAIYQELRNNSNLLRCVYYTALQPREVQSPLRKITDWLQYNNYSVITKEVREFEDKNTGIKKVKANMDIEIALDMMELTPYVDHLLLFSGDGDFVRLVDTIQRKGRKVTVISTIKTNPAFAADILRRQADHFIDLTAWTSVHFEYPQENKTDAAE